MKLVINHANDVALDTIVIPNVGCHPTLNHGEVANLPKRCRNTTPPPCPSHPGHIIHDGITHGTGSAIGGVCYVLVLIDKSTSYIYMNMA